MIVTSAQTFPPKFGDIQDLVAGLTKHICRTNYAARGFADNRNEPLACDAAQHSLDFTKRPSEQIFFKRFMQAHRQVLNSSGMVSTFLLLSGRTAMNFLTITEKETAFCNGQVCSCAK